MKFLHTTGAVLLAGGLGSFMLALTFGPGIDDAAGYAALRQSLAGVANWIIVPGMGLVTTSGLLAMGVHHPFQDQPWVWVKAVSGILIFEATLASVAGPADRAAEVARQVMDGELAAAELALRVDDKWVAWWVLMILSALNVAFAIWRPRLGRKKIKTNS